MSQFIIEYSHSGAWRPKYISPKYRAYAVISVPAHLRGEQRIIGAIVDNRRRWADKMDEISQKTEYDIIPRNPERVEEDL